MNISSRFLKLSGSFELPDDLEAGRDYEITVTGSIPSYKPSDNQDGTWDIEYHFKPLIGQIKSDKGESTRLNLKASSSQKMRAMIVRVWGEQYEQVMNVLLANGEELREFYEKHK